MVICIGWVVGLILEALLDVCGLGPLRCCQLWAKTTWPGLFCRPRPTGRPHKGRQQLCALVHLT